MASVTASTSLSSATTLAASSAAVASSTAASDVGSAIVAFFQVKENVSLYIVIPIIALLYTAACVSYAVSRCRRKKVRAARRRRRTLSGDVEFVNAQAVRHGSESSLKSLLSRDRNRVAPEKMSADRQNSTSNRASEKVRNGHTLDFVASSCSFDACERPAASLGISPGARESGEGKRASLSTRFSDPSILAAIKEEPTGAGGTVHALDASLRNFRGSNYTDRATNAAARMHRLTSPGARTPGLAGSLAASAARPSDAADRRSRSIPIQEHVEEALQSLKMNSSIDAPAGKDLREAMRAVISLEMEVKSDPKAQELIAKYRESKQKSRQTTVHDSLKKGEWQKVPISDWIALKRAASETESRPGSKTARDPSGRY